MKGKMASICLICTSAGLFHEVKYFEEAVLAGKKESDILGLEESLKIIELCDEIRKQIGLVYPWDPK